MLYAGDSNELLSSEDSNKFLSSEDSNKLLLPVDMVEYNSKLLSYDLPSSDDFSELVPLEDIIDLLGLKNCY